MARKPVATDHCVVAGVLAMSRVWRFCSWPATCRHRLVPLKKPRDPSSQAVRTELS